MGLTQKLGTIPLAIQTDSSNNVGIGGAANASYKLAVTGASLFSSSVQIQSSNGIKLNRSANDYYWQINSDSSNYLNFGAYLANGTAYGTNPKMILLDNGNVGIGTASPTHNLEIANASGSVYQKMNADFGIGYFGMETADDSMRFVTAQATPIQFYTNNTERMRIRADGNIFLNSVVYNNTVGGTVRNIFINNDNALGGISSIRASKKNIQEFDSNWIYDLKPVQFNYRKKDDEGNYTEEIYEDIIYGLIAEETAPIADFLINYNDKEDGTKEMVGIEYMRLITPMLKAIQELSAKVTALENK